MNMYQKFNRIIFFFIPGYLLFKDFCENVSEEPVPHLKFYEEVSCLCSTSIHSFEILFTFSSSLLFAMLKELCNALY